MFGFWNNSCEIARELCNKDGFVEAYEVVQTAFIQDMSGKSLIT